MIVVFVLQTTSQFWILCVFYANRSYIAATLCVNRFDKIPICKGSCVLEKQLNEDESRQQKAPDLKNKEVDLFLNIPIAQVQKNNFAVNKRNPYPFYSDNRMLKNFHPFVFRPPSAIV